MSIIKVVDEYNKSIETLKAVSEETILNALNELLQKFDSGGKIYIEVTNCDECTELLKPISKDEVLKEVEAALKEFPLEGGHDVRIILTECSIIMKESLRSIHICRSDRMGVHFHDEGDDRVIIKGSSLQGVFDQVIVFNKEDIPNICKFLQEWV